MTIHHPDRREFLQRMHLAAAGSLLAPLTALHLNEAIADGPGIPRSQGFGVPKAATPQNSDTLGALAGEALISLPEGFAYRALSIAGHPMSDGTPVPQAHDGMGCFQRKSSTGTQYVIVRNHELDPERRLFSRQLSVRPPDHEHYDDGIQAGGTTTLTLDGNANLLHHAATLGGTIRNCAGGTTPWQTWLSCEESVVTPDMLSAVSRRHGYVFEVPAFGDDTARVREPLTTMGRFNHEAACVDPATGHIYLTEDRGDSVLYRYIPATVPTQPGERLRNEGKLYALALIPGQRATHDSAVASADMRTGMKPFVGQPLKVRWIELDDVDSEADDLRKRARDQGASVFARGEGITFHNSRAYFCATSGGDDERGQVFGIDPASDELTLIVEASSSDALRSPDNITAGTDGVLYVCEDGSGQDHVRGIEPSGRMFDFAANLLNDSELTGGCFSPDGTIFFVNIQNPGVTLAVYRTGGGQIKL